MFYDYGYDYGLVKEKPFFGRDGEPVSKGRLFVLL